MGKNNELKMFANLAKQRLLKNGYNETTNKKNKVKGSSYYLKNANAVCKLQAKMEYKIINNNLDDGFINSVKELLSLEYGELSSLNILADKEILKTLSGFDKEMYILKLSDKYNQALNQLCIV